MPQIDFLRQSETHATQLNPASHQSARMLIAKVGINLIDACSVTIVATIALQLTNSAALQSYSDNASASLRLTNLT